MNAIRDETKTLYRVADCSKNIIETFTGTISIQIFAEFGIPKKGRKLDTGVNPERFCKIIATISSINKKFRRQKSALRALISSLGHVFHTC